MWKLFVSNRRFVCVADVPNEKQHRVCRGINQTLCVQPSPAAGGSQVLQCEVHACQKPQCLLSPHSQVTTTVIHQVEQHWAPLNLCCRLGDVLRNNLTVIDTIVLHGRGATESLKVAGKPPGQGSSLRFKMTEALLKDCTESEFMWQIDHKSIQWTYVCK